MIAVRIEVGPIQGSVRGSTGLLRFRLVVRGIGVSSWCQREIRSWRRFRIPEGGGCLLFPVSGARRKQVPKPSLCDVTVRFTEADECLTVPGFDRLGDANMIIDNSVVC